MFFGERDPKAFHFRAASRMVDSMQFASITVLGAEHFDPACRAEIEKRSRAPVQWVQSSAVADLGWVSPQGSAATDALLISLRIQVDAAMLQRLPCLRYLGLFGTNLAPIDQDTCRERKIRVTRVLGYCDPETAQWCVAAALQVARGMGEVALADAPRSIAALSWGILGLGSVGREVLAMVRALGGSCYSIRRPSYPEMEGLEWLNPAKLRSTCRIFSLHVPPHTRVWESEELAELRGDAVVIDTCIGQAYDDEAMRAFVDRGGILVLDALSSLYHPTLIGHPRVYAYSMRAHATLESDERRRAIFVGHMDAFLADPNPPS